MIVRSSIHLIRLDLHFSIELVCVCVYVPAPNPFASTSISRDLAYTQNEIY